MTRASLRVIVDAEGGFAILTLKQLPDSRRSIVLALKERGSATIAQLSPSLGLTGEAVRQQLLQLQREGWIEAVVDRGTVRGRTGRPSTVYRLTDAGEHLFPKDYDALSIAVIDAVADELGMDATVRVLARVSNDRVDALAPRVEGRTLEERLEILRGWYAAGDPYMTHEREGDDYRLIERNCPFYNTAMNRPALCSVSVSALTRLLGVRVRREEKFQNGDGRCVFRVYANEPVTDWQFELETLSS
ncbi:MAG TPA: DNA-binding protein [Thermoanaerobaculia bacterium]|nr:DNA-binding protein [Thermoanaerobaculia bacterium]